MIPGGALSVSPVPGAFIWPDDQQPLTQAMGYVPQDWELGGIALNDSSLGLQVQRWTFALDGDAVTVTPDGGTPTVLFTAAGITELSGAFDSNMAPAAAYVQAEVLKLYWFDTAIPGYATTTFDGENPRLTLDDKRPLHAADRDVLLIYLRAGSIYYRQQRDRYGVEYLLGALPAGTERLGRVGMGTTNRVQIECLGAAV
jgi:hypothetical protein